MSHLVFHGGLWYALSIIGMGITYCILKAAYDTYKGKSSPHS
jgi:divalent metal cation (Fe/Co/Zn/Cd) transporter